MIFQPVYLDEHGTKRFYGNKIIQDVINKYRDFGVYILNEMYSLDAPLDDFRHFNQLINYSVSGFGDLNCAHKLGDSDLGYDYYIELVDNLPITEPHKLKHPISNIVCYDVVVNKFCRTQKLKFEGNELIKKIFEKYIVHASDYINDEKYTIADKRQLLQLLGYTFADYFDAPFNNTHFECSGEAIIDIVHHGELIDHYLNLLETANDKENDYKLIGKRVCIVDLEKILYEVPNGLAPLSTSNKKGFITDVDLGAEDEYRFEVTFNDEHSYFNSQKGHCDWMYKREQFTIIEG